MFIGLPSCLRFVVVDFDIASSLVFDTVVIDFVMGTSKNPYRIPAISIGNTS